MPYLVIFINNKKKFIKFLYLKKKLKCWKLVYDINVYIFISLEF